jgi:hypothetical protein
MLFFNSYAQKNMLIEQISGKTITRESFDDKGKLLSKQVMKVSQVGVQNKIYQVSIDIDNYDEDNKLSKSNTTNYRCKPNESSLLIMLIPLSNVNASKMKIISSSVNFKELYDFTELKDIIIKVGFDSGALSLFGSKGTISLNSRKWNPTNEELVSQLRFTGYALRIQVKKVTYTVKEKFTNEKLVFQRFSESDGSYFTMKYSK